MKIKLALFALLFFNQILSAQLEVLPDQASDQPQWLFGLTLAPQAITTFEGDPPFVTDMPVYIGPTWLSGAWGVSPFYNFGGHSVGVFLTYAFTPGFGSYLVVDQSLDTNFGIYGLGFTTPLVEPYILGFIEIGGSYGDVSGANLLIGAYFLLSKQL
ncbi:MAG: hypothetical protein AAFR97_10850 [Bacteroidota bacterium]